jgi:hypothetical protein
MGTIMRFRVPTRAGGARCPATYVPQLVAERTHFEHRLTIDR